MPTRLRRWATTSAGAALLVLALTPTLPTMLASSRCAAQRPVRVSLPPLLNALGVKLADSRVTPTTIAVGQRFAVLVVNPERLAAAGLPGARAGDRGALALQQEQAKLAAELTLQAAESAVAGGAERTTADQRKRSVRIGVAPPSGGLPPDSI